MKFQCHCGQTIADQTDELYYKARYVADQDWNDFLESKASSGGLDWRYARHIYQCSNCGRLYVERPDRKSFVSFELEEELKQDKKILVSTKEHQWKRTLTGTWNSSEKSKQMAKGHLHFEDCFGDGFEKFNDWAAMEIRYYELFEQHQQGETLRSAFLEKDGKILHEWPKLG